MFSLCLRSPSQIRTAVRSLQPIFRAFLLPSFLLLAYSSQLQAQPVEEPIIELIEEPIEEPAMEPTTDMEMDAEAPAEEDFAAADAAQSGEEELGRERRA